jgi:putative flippase GtrA
MTFARYVAVQLAAYALDMGTFLVLLHGGVAGPVPANVAAKIAAGGFAFFAHRAFTFRLGGTARAGEAARYAILLALNVPLASVLLAALLQVVPHPVAAKFLSDVVCVGLTFLLTRHAVFGRADR